MLLLGLGGVGFSDLYVLGGQLSRRVLGKSGFSYTFLLGILLKPMHLGMYFDYEARIKMRQKIECPLCRCACLYISNHGHAVPLILIH